MSLPDNSIAQNSSSQAGISPIDALEILKIGNQRFLEKRVLNRDLHQQVAATSGGQWPFAVVLSCIDSRIPTEMIFDQGIGDIFNARVAGNFVNPDILGSIEYGCKVAGSKAVVVMGHTSCGAVKGACDHVQLGNITQMLDKIMPAVKSVYTPEGTDRSSQNLHFVNAVSKKNVEFTIENIRKESPILNEMEEVGEIVIAGAMYDVKSGKVTFY
jgi:carbonic anhydrase